MTQDIDYWKVAVYDEDAGGYVVKKVCLRSVYEAMAVADRYAERGLLARASRHVGKSKEFIYGKQ